MKAFRTATVFMATALALTACGSSDPDGEGASVVEPTATAVAPVVTEEAAPTDQTTAFAEKTPPEAVATAATSLIP